MTAITSRASTTFQTINSFSTEMIAVAASSTTDYRPRRPKKQPHDFGVGVLDGRIRTATAVMM